MGSYSTNFETPLDYRMKVPRFEDMNDELDFIDQQFCDVDDDIRGHFEWARKETNCENISTLTRVNETENYLGKASLCSRHIEIFEVATVSG